MTSFDFINETINNYDEKIFNEVKKVFLEKYLIFYFHDLSDIGKLDFLEKVVDYIEKLELKTGKEFEKHVKNYISDLSSLVKGKIKDKSRAYRYYELANKKIDTKVVSLIQITDFTRIILCIYSEIIKSEEKEIDNFNLSIDSIELKNILLSMENEKLAEVDLGVINFGLRNRFNTKELYSSDTFTFMLVIIMYYHLMNLKVEGE